MSNKFYPKPGDTIVTRSGQKWICMTREDYCKRLSMYTLGSPNPDTFVEDIFAFRKDYQGCSHMRWMHDGISGSGTYNIVEIIPKQTVDYEFKIRVLEKENEILRRMLYNQGVEL